MNRRFIFAVALLVIAAGALQLSPAALAQAAGNWTTLFDGTSLNGWNRTGDANWTLADGAVQADKGDGFLVTSGSYGDFDLRAEFWVDADANSGIFIRCQNPQAPGSATGYEVNIYDKRPDQSYRTGGIVDVASPLAKLDTGNRWNVMEISAHGTHLTVTLNGTRTADVNDSKHARGPIGLQYGDGANGAGIVKFRKVEIRTN
jgi:3-keto-disaccharide hydrolase